MGFDWQNKKAPSTAAPHPAKVAQRSPVAPHPATIVQRQPLHVAKAFMIGQARGVQGGIAQRAQAPEKAVSLTTADKARFGVEYKELSVKATARYVPQARWDFSTSDDVVWWTTGMGPCRAVGMIGDNGSAFTHADEDPSTTTTVQAMLNAVGAHPRVYIINGGGPEPKLLAQINEALGNTIQATVIAGNTKTDAVMDVGNSMIYSGSLKFKIPKAIADAVADYNGRRGQQASYTGPTGAGSSHVFQSIA